LFLLKLVGQGLVGLHQTSLYFPYKSGQFMIGVYQSL